MKKGEMSDTGICKKESAKSADGPPMPPLLAQDWNPTDIALILGPRISGKTTLVQSLLRDTKMRDQAEIVTDISSLKSLEEKVQQLFVPVTEKEGEKKKKTIIILDDVQPHWLDTPSMKKIVLNGRFYGIGLWIIQQTMQSVPTWLKNNADKVLFLRTCSETETQDYLSYLEWFNQSPNEKGRQMLEFATRDFGALVYDARAQGKEDRFKCYRATL